jgi:hypothetical protein
VDAPVLDDCVSFLKTVEYLAVQAFVPELSGYPSFFVGRKNTLALFLHHPDLPQLCDDLLNDQPFSGYFPSPSQVHV